MLLSRLVLVLIGSSLVLGGVLQRENAKAPALSQEAAERYLSLIAERSMREPTDEPDRNEEEEKAESTKEGDASVEETREEKPAAEEEGGEQGSGDAKVEETTTDESGSAAAAASAAAPAAGSGVEGTPTASEGSASTKVATPIRDGCRICLHLAMRVVPRDPKNELLSKFTCTLPTEGFESSLQDGCLAFVQGHETLLRDVTEPTTVCEGLKFCSTPEIVSFREEEEGRKKLGEGSFQLFSGAVNVGIGEKNFRYLSSGEGLRTGLQRVSFETQYEAVPVVQVTLTSFKFSPNHAFRVKTEVENVDRYGFDLIITTWKHTEIKDLKVNWIAYGQVYHYRNLIRVGEITSGASEPFARRIRFPRDFAKVPFVSIGFSGFSAARGTPFSASLTAEEVDAEGFTAVMKTTAEAQIHLVDIVWIAYIPEDTNIFGFEERLNSTVGSFRRLARSPYGPRAYSKQIEFNPEPVVQCVAENGATRPAGAGGEALLATSSKATVGTASQAAATATSRARSRLTHLLPRKGTNTYEPFEDMVRDSARRSRPPSIANRDPADEDDGLADPSAYVAAVNHDNPDAAWLLTDRAGDGFCNDTSGNGVTATVEAADPATFKFRGAPRLVSGAARSIAASKGYIAVRQGQFAASREISNLTSDFSVEVWVRPILDRPVMALVTRLNVGSPTDQRNGFALYFQGRRAVFSLYKNGLHSAIVSPVDAMSGVTYHIVATVSGGGRDMNLWINGALVRTAPTQGVTAGFTRQLLYIAAFDSPGGRMWGFLHGDLGPVAVYTSALTPDRVRAHFNIGGSGKAGVEGIVSAGEDKSMSARERAWTPAGWQGVTSLVGEVDDVANGGIRPRRCTTVTQDPPRFDGPPLVNLRLSGMGFSAAGGARLTAEAVDITALGFTLRVETWDETELQMANVAWTAMPRPVGYPPEGPQPPASLAGKGTMGTFNTPDTAMLSCRKILLAGASLGNGLYWVTAFGESARVFCDMSDGGWSRVINIVPGSYDHASKVAVNLGALRNKDLPARLSDAAISEMNTLGFYKVTCGSYKAFVRTASNQWNSDPSNRDEWSVNRSLRLGDMDNDAWCDATSRGAGFSDEKSVKARKCGKGIRDFMRYADATDQGEKGCFHSAAGAGWDQPGSVWVQ